MPDDAKTEELFGYTPPRAERVMAALFEARPGRPGELLLQVFIGGRLVEMAVELSAGDRVVLAEAVAGVQARPSQTVGWDVTVRTPLPPPD